MWRVQEIVIGFWQREHHAKVSFLLQLKANESNANYMLRKTDGGETTGMITGNDWGIVRSSCEAAIPACSLTRCWDPIDPDYNLECKQVMSHAKS